MKRLRHEPLVVILPVLLLIVLLILLDFPGDDLAGGSSNAAMSRALTSLNRVGDCEDVLAYTASQNGGHDVWVADLCDWQTFPLTVDGSSGRPVWSPDGQALAFENSAQPGASQVYVYETDSGVARHVSGGLLHALYASWSPEGNRLSLAGLSGPVQGRQIYVVNRDGSGLRHLVDSPGSATASAWSPDGTRIAFISHLGESEHKINIVDQDGSNLITLALPGYPEDTLAWHPSGRQIAFVSTDFHGRGKSGGYNLYLLHLDTLAFEQVTHVHQVHTFAWSPDGDRLLYAAVLGAGDLAQLFIRDNEVPGRGAGAPLAEGRWPAWSPDGSRIAFVSSQSGKIYVMGADGSDPTQVTGEGSSLYLAWRPRP